jgi:hypothetical protein
MDRDCGEDDAVIAALHWDPREVRGMSDQHIDM